VRGIGPITSTALLAKQIEPGRFDNAREFAAYFGVAPNQTRTAAEKKSGLAR
jgi:transposase